MTRDRGLRSTVVMLVAVLVATSLVALVAGWIYGRTNPEGAGAALVGDLVIEEPVGSNGGDPEAPTSGRSHAVPTCGVRGGPVPADVQVASLDAGAVVIQYRPDDVGTPARAELARLAEGGAPVLVAPNPGIGSPVTATAWTRRLPLHGVRLELLEAFVAQYAEEGACRG